MDIGHLGLGWACVCFLLSSLFHLSLHLNLLCQMVEVAYRKDSHDTKNKAQDLQEGEGLSCDNCRPACLMQ